MQRKNVLLLLLLLLLLVQVLVSTSSLHLRVWVLCLVCQLSYLWFFRLLLAVVVLVLSAACGREQFRSYSAYRISDEHMSCAIFSLSVICSSIYLSVPHRGAKDCCCKCHCASGELALSFVLRCFHMRSWYFIIVYKRVRWWFFIERFHLNLYTRWHVCV